MLGPGNKQTCLLNQRDRELAFWVFLTVDVI